MLHCPAAPVAVPCRDCGSVSLTQQAWVDCEACGKRLRAPSRRSPPAPPPCAVDYEVYERRADDPRCRGCEQPIRADLTHCYSCKQTIREEKVHRFTELAFLFTFLPVLGFLTRSGLSALYGLVAGYIVVMILVKRVTHPYTPRPLPLRETIAAAGVGALLHCFPWHLLGQSL